MLFSLTKGGNYHPYITNMHTWWCPL